MTQFLSQTQYDSIKDQFAELVVDQMDVNELMAIVHEHLMDTFDAQTIYEFKESVDNYDENLFNDLLDSVGVRKEEKDAFLNDDPYTNIPSRY